VTYSVFFLFLSLAVSSCISTEYQWDQGLVEKSKRVTPYWRDTQEEVLYRIDGRYEFIVIETGVTNLREGLAQGKAKTFTRSKAVMLEYLEGFTSVDYSSLEAAKRQVKNQYRKNINITDIYMEKYEVQPADAKKYMVWNVYFLAEFDPLWIKDVMPETGHVSHH